MELEEPEREHESAAPDMSSEKGSITPDGAETEAETPTMAHDSMVTVRLSEPPNLCLDTASIGSHASTPESIDQEEECGNPELRNETDIRTSTGPRTSSTTLSSTEARQTLDDGADECGSDDNDRSSSGDEDVDWEALEKTEDAQTKDEETDNSTAMLLARLEQENAKLATNPKSVKVQATEGSKFSTPRPPSMAQLRQMVSGPTPSALRYSMLPPPPMTDLEFFLALVKDYQQTAARLPTLLSNKVRKGIPPPLRGIVWQSMAGGRDAILEEQYERFCGESSPYELLIGKDLGRSFPGVEMFRDPEGDGQRMLGRVLRAFSLYDTKIGYCQGLAFLVGPLLMHMPDKQAFCVLVRLMERYDLRGCFLPDLSGLHVRIYQFRELLRFSLPALATRLEELQVDPAYVSQWFLSFFAVTCPLPMLFRIYDVVFAEGASETLMRVGLSLMRKNESRLLACTELEDVMQLLLSRSLWDCYHYNADEFVEDFVSMTGAVTRENLAQLEQGYKESRIATVSTVRSSAITTAATRFLGRIWASSATVPAKTAALSPGLNAPSRPISMLHRSTSKQSLASTLNSIEASSASVASSTSTDATTASRDSANTEEGSLSRESTPVGPKTAAGARNTDNRYLHSQIEDLLTALSELQRNHALLSNQLQREREERDEDRKAVRSLLDGLRRKASADSVATEGSGTTAKPSETSNGDDEHGDGDVLDDTTSTPGEAEPATEHLTEEAPSAEGSSVEEAPSAEDLSVALDLVESRFRNEDTNRRSSMLQSKAQLRVELANAKEQLASADCHYQELTRRILEQEHELGAVKEQLRESHSHARVLHQDKQRLERQIVNMKVRASTVPIVEPASREPDASWASKGPAAGLRELKLGRSKSTPSQAAGYNNRISSLPKGRESMLPLTAGSVSTSLMTTTEHDDVLLELAQSKTSEAVARQEVEEARREAEESKQKLEMLRKAYGLAPEDSPSVSATTGAAAAGAMGVFGRLTGQGAWPAGENGGGGAAGASPGSKPPVTTPNGSAAGGSFWSWRR